LTDEQLVATFGWSWRIQTPLANIGSYQITGPYRWWRAIGPRGSLADRGFTFGTSTHGGVCLQFREPIPWYWRGAMTDLTVTVDDLEGLATELERRGIHGEDRRSRVV
jgi:hypothetical protein